MTFLRRMSVMLLALCAQSTTHADVTVDFEELNSYTNTQIINGQNQGQYYNGYSFVSQGSWTSKGIEFNQGTDNFGFGTDYFGGWSYSNVNNTTSPGYSGFTSVNQFAAITGTGFGGSGNYALANGDFSYFNIPNNLSIQSLYLTNATYAYLSMLNGDDFFPDPFGQTLDANDNVIATNVPDFFRVVFTGYSGLNGEGSIVGSPVEFYLGDYRSTDPAEDYLVDTWEFLDLESLSNARSISLSFVSSKANSFGSLTPTYVAIDNIAFVTAVPEPASLAVVGAAASACLARRIRKRKLAKDTI